MRSAKNLAFLRERGFELLTSGTGVMCSIPGTLRFSYKVAILFSLIISNNELEHLCATSVIVLFALLKTTFTRLEAN